MSKRVKIQFGGAGIGGLLLCPLEKIVMVDARRDQIVVLADTDAREPKSSRPVAFKVFVMSDDVNPALWDVFAKLGNLRIATNWNFVCGQPRILAPHL